MHMLKDSKILKNFITKQLEKLYTKISSIDKQEFDRIEAFVERLEGENINFDPYEDYEKTKALAQALENVSNIDLVKLYIFLNVELDLKIELKDVKDHYEELESKGHHQIEDYVFYFDYGIDGLEIRAKEILEDDLEDVDKVIDTFSIYELAEMWIFQTSTKVAINEYVDYNGWMDILQLVDLGTAYYDEYGCEIQYALNEGSENFE